MTERINKHDPIMSGVKVQIGIPLPNDLPPAITVPGVGITALARRTSDNALVAVTNAHNVVLPGGVNPQGNELLFQPTYGSSYQQALRRAKPIGEMDGNNNFVKRFTDREDNEVDACYFVLNDERKLTHTLHSHPFHTPRRIIPNTKTPEPNLPLVALFFKGGEKEIRVNHVGQPSTIKPEIKGHPTMKYRNQVDLDIGPYEIQDGDSGSPCFYKVNENEYQLCCIIYAGQGTQAWAFPARRVEELLGITFGNTPPRATASAVPVAYGTKKVSLNGSNSIDPDGGDLSFLWEFDGTQDELERLGLVINNDKSEVANFIAPNENITLRFKLTVTDVAGEQATDTVTIKVIPSASSIPHPKPPGNAYPPISLSQWNDTGKTRGCGAARGKQQFRLKNLVPQYRWVPAPEEEIWGEWEDTELPPRNETAGEWEDAGESRIIGGVLEKKQTRTVSLENQQKRTSHCDNTQHRWEQKTRTDTRWEPVSLPPLAPQLPPIPIPTPSAWEDCDPLEFRGCGPSREKKQCRVNNGVTEYQWVVAPEELVWTEWADTGETLISGTGAWRDEGSTSGCGPDKEKRQSRTISREKEQESTNQCGGSKTQWVPTTSVTQTQWVSAPEELIWTQWADTGDIRNSGTGTWRDDGRTRDCGPNKEKRQSRTISREKEQESTNQCGGSKTQWVSTTSVTQTQWASDSEPYRWRTVNDGSPTTTYTAWSNLGEPYLSGSSCKQVQIRQSTTVQRRKQVNHCNDGVERSADPVRTTRNYRQVITVTETWGNWSYTGATHYDDIEDVMYYEQERFSSPCNRRQTKWVTTRP